MYKQKAFVDQENQLVVRIYLGEDVKRHRSDMLDHREKIQRPILFDLQTVREHWEIEMIAEKRAYTWWINNFIK